MLDEGQLAVAERRLVVLELQAQAQPASAQILVGVGEGSCEYLYT
jgi:hypothetical protein